MPPTVSEALYTVIHVHDVKSENDAKRPPASEADAGCVGSAWPSIPGPGSLPLSGLMAVRVRLAEADRTDLSVPNVAAMVREAAEAAHTASPFDDLLHGPLLRVMAFLDCRDRDALSLAASGIHQVVERNLFRPIEADIDELILQIQSAQDKAASLDSGLQTWSRGDLSKCCEVLVLCLAVMEFVGAAFPAAVAAVAPTDDPERPVFAGIAGFNALSTAVLLSWFVISRLCKSWGAQLTEIRQTETNLLKVAHHLTAHRSRLLAARLQGDS